MVPGKVLTWKRVDFADKKEGLTQGGAEFLLSGGFFVFWLTKKRPESVLKREDVRREESCLTCVVVFEPVWFCFTCVVVFYLCGCVILCGFLCFECLGDFLCEVVSPLRILCEIRIREKPTWFRFIVFPDKREFRRKG